MTKPLAGHGWSVRTDGAGITVILAGDWIAREASVGESHPVQQIVDAAKTHGIVFDSSQLGHWDSSLLVFVTALRQAAREHNQTIDETGLPPTALRLLALTSETQAVEAPAPDRPAWVDRVGKSVIATWDDTREIMTIVGETVLRGGAAIGGSARMRGVDLMTCLHEAGAAALPIVTIVNVLVGGILAFVGAVQLRRFGADIYIANLVGVAMVREMAALMTAIVMSGRTGGAYAAHIATMQGNEEIDALRAIGIPVYDYLILPRVIALTSMMPLLYLYGSAVGIIGGFLVAISMLNLSPELFIEQTRASVAGSQIFFGLIKSITFGALIAIVGCRCGLKAGRSAADVGKAATSAVVIGIVGVIALDAIFAICANALDF